jgi:putative transposase
MFIMETMQRKQPRRRRSFTPEFKAEIVERCLADDRTIGQVAKDFDLTETAVRAWVTQAETDAGERPGLTSDERAGAGPAAAGEQVAPRGRGGPEAGDGFFRAGDPVKAQSFIGAGKAAGHGVARACRLLKVSRAAYYQRRTGVPSPRRAADVILSAKITGIHTESRGTYGSPRVHRALRRQGAGCGTRRVTRLMRAAGLEGRRKKRWRTTTIADPAAERPRDLIQRDFAPRPGTDQRYAGDITYLMTWEGWAYLATVIDLSSRRVVGWALADHMRTSLVEDALSMAFTPRRPADGVIFHSDYAEVDVKPGNLGMAC